MFWKKQAKKESPKGPALSCVHHGVCSKEHCPMWVRLNITAVVEGKSQPQLEGRCTFAWMPQMLIELRNTVGTVQRVD